MADLIEQYGFTDGYVDVPSGHGLGVDLAQEVLDRLAVGVRPLPVRV